jgi:hypothetical protein
MLMAFWLEVIIDTILPLPLPHPRTARDGGAKIDPAGAGRRRGPTIRGMGRVGLGRVGVRNRWRRRRREVGSSAARHTGRGFAVGDALEGEASGHVVKSIFIRWEDYGPNHDFHWSVNPALNSNVI